MCTYMPVPNSRDPNKRQIGVWLRPDEVQALDALAQKLGITRADLLRALVSEKTDFYKNAKRRAKVT